MRRQKALQLYLCVESVGFFVWQGGRGVIRLELSYLAPGASSPSTTAGYATYAL